MSLENREAVNSEHDANRTERPGCAEIINAWHSGLPETEQRLTIETIAALSLNQLLTGIFTGLAQKGITSLPIGEGRIDEVFVAVCGELDKLTEKEGLEPAFLLRLGFWGSSRTLRAAFDRAVQRGVVKSNLLDQEIRLSAHTLRYEDLSGQTGSAEMYERLAAALLAEWRLS